MAAGVQTTQQDSLYEASELQASSSIGTSTLTRAAAKRGPAELVQVRLSDADEIYKDKTAFAKKLRSRKNAIQVRRSIGHTQGIGGSRHHKSVGSDESGEPRTAR